MYLIISTSTNANSRSVRLARLAQRIADDLVDQAKLIDLADFDLPIDDGTRSNEPIVQEITDLVGQSEAIILVVPIYRGDISIPTRNLVQLCGTAWQRKVVGLISVAGEAISHAATINLASAMMLEHRNFIVPDFVFAESKMLSESLKGSSLERKVRKLVTTLVRITESLKRA